LPKFDKHFPINSSGDRFAAITLTPFEIDRWNSDDQAIATLADAHRNHFFTEPRYGKYGVESRAWRKGLAILAGRSPST